MRRKKIGSKHINSQLCRTHQQSNNPERFAYLLCWDNSGCPRCWDVFLAIMCLRQSCMFTRRRKFLCVAHKENLGRSSEAIPHRLLFGVFPFFLVRMLYLFFIYLIVFYLSFFICVRSHRSAHWSARNCLQAHANTALAIIVSYQRFFSLFAHFQPTADPTHLSSDDFFTIFRAVNTALKFSKWCLQPWLEMKRCFFHCCTILYN